MTHTTLARVRPILDAIAYELYAQWPPAGYDYADALPYLRFFLTTPDALGMVAAPLTESQEAI